MTPAQFLAALKRNLAPAYLFLGAESYDRRRSKEALLRLTLPPKNASKG